jgi:hypothetical protein
MHQLLLEGIKESGKNVPTRYIAETPEAISYAFENAVKGELVVILGDTVRKDIEVVNKYREEIAQSNGA